jgi:hypothetical protein
MSRTLEKLAADSKPGAFDFADDMAGEVEGWIATFHENERPLLGLAGRLDWRFHGAISQYLKAGAISGKLGECAYLPVALPLLPERTYHLILVGLGASQETPALNSAMVQRLVKNLKSLGVKKFGISKTDFGDLSALKEIPLWVTA